MSEFTNTLKKMKNIKNNRERERHMAFCVINYLRENKCCIPREDWVAIVNHDYDPWCLIDEVTEYWTPEMKQKIAKIWWDTFATIKTDDCGYITEPFMFWSEGTHGIDILVAMEEFFGINKEEEEGNDMDNKAINNRDLTPEMAFDDNNYPMVSSGTYLNYWTTEADYDVFIIFHELQIHQHDEICEKVVHQIMNHRKKTDTKEQLAKRVQTALEALVDWEEYEPCVFITHMKEVK